MAEVNHDILFARLIVESGLCSDEELKMCKEKLKALESDDTASLEKILLEEGLITKRQAERIKKTVTEQKKTSHQIPGYKVLGKLGAGAMAVVYKAKQLSLDRTVAINILQLDYNQNPK